MSPLASVPVQRSPRLQRPVSYARHDDIPTDLCGSCVDTGITVAGIEVGLVSGRVSFSATPEPMTRRQAQALVTALEHLIDKLPA